MPNVWAEGGRHSKIKHPPPVLPAERAFVSHYETYLNGTGSISKSGITVILNIRCLAWCLVLGRVMPNKCNDDPSTKPSPTKQKLKRKKI